MAPNLAVRSDSWLDLTRLDSQQLASFRHSVRTNDHRHSMDVGRLARNETRRARATPTLARIASIQPQEQSHLLIRMRQNSFLNRSSASLANSVELAPSQVSCQSESAAPLGHERLSSAADCRLPSSRRLEHFRAKLERRSRRRNQRPSSELARSWSSLSDRLSGKLTDFRHSWKQFLYNYSHRDTDQRKLNRPDWASHRQRSESPDQLDKSQLTSERLARHHSPQEQPLRNSHSQDERPKSLIELSAQTRQTDRVGYAIGWPTATAPGEQQVNLAEAAGKRTSKQLHSSSSTLVSQPSNFVKESSSSTNSTLNSEKSRHLTAEQNSRLEAFAMDRQFLEQRPILVADQDYYLDVASVQQQVSEPAMLCRPASLLLPNNQATLDDDYDDYAVPSDESCRLDRSQVELVQMIGEGQKGFVFLGKLQSKDGRSICDVAIKTLKYETDQLIDKLMREAAMMRQLEHPHIIKFIGVCPETPALIAMELAEFGEVKQYLKLNKHLIGASQLVLFTFQISTALSYLESKQYVHRDVAARNVLVCSHNCVKLADFGLSRNLQTPANQAGLLNNNKLLRYQHPLTASQLDEDDEEEANGASQYVAAPRVKLPVRWLAPESLALRRFSSASDVWMFAVCSWELFHYGQVRPWAQIRNQQVLGAIESGQRLARPPVCPTRLYQLMLQCWSYAPGQRPKFRELKQTIWSIYLNERTREQLELEQQQKMFLLARQQQQQVMLLNGRQQLVASGLPSQPPVNNIPSPAPKNAQRRKSPKLETMTTSSRLSASPMMLNYLNGYSSSTTATVDQSTNSSRSSSMGSLARQKNKQVMSTRPAATSQLTKNSRPIARQDDIRSGQRRFQRTPGHLLQKQRSQGSLASEMADGRVQLKPYGLDDSALPLNHARRPLSSELNRFGRSNVFDMEEEDSYQDSSSDLDTFERPAERCLVANMNRLALHESSNKCRLQEPAYDGLNNEVAMINSDLRQGSVVLERAPSFSPIAGRRSAAAQSASSTVNQFNDTRREHKLSNILQTLRMAPTTKAGLTSAGSGKQASRRPPTKSEPKQPLEQQQHQEEEEEEQKLALHQRLLGHIRPQWRSVQSDTQQRPTAGKPSGPVETVDQSLKLLESLISDKSHRGGRSKEAEGPVSHTKALKVALLNRRL